MRTITIALGLLVGAFLVLAQSGRGSLDGTVFDRIGHKVAAASVAAKNTATGAVFTAESNGQGVYALSLPAGTYEVSVTAAGHKSTQEGILITPERPLHGIDVVLAIP